jgi:hypothetical protein
MVVLLFCSDEVWRSCCNATRMRQLWGTAAAHQLSRRLQQLEAMTTLSDLDFLPFAATRLQDGVIEVAVDGRLALILKAEPDESKGDAPMNTITVTGVRERSTQSSST